MEGCATGETAALQILQVGLKTSAAQSQPGC
jgi:hypothetical protein